MKSPCSLIRLKHSWCRKCLLSASFKIAYPPLREYCGRSSCRYRLPVKQKTAVSPGTAGPIREGGSEQDERATECPPQHRSGADGQLCHEGVRVRPTENVPIVQLRGKTDIFPSPELQTASLRTYVFIISTFLTANFSVSKSVPDMTHKNGSRYDTK